MDIPSFINESPLSPEGTAILSTEPIDPIEAHKTQRMAFITSYDGREFHGWQRQGADRSIQGTIEEALNKLTGLPLNITGSGRTDAGVSAHGQVFHLDIPIRENRPWTPESLLKGVNHFLPQQIRILSAVQTPRTFHARHDVERKIYRYRLRIVPQKHIRLPLDDPFTGVFFAPVDFRLLKSASLLFLGNHDFTHFTVKKSLPPKTQRTIQDIFWERDGSDYQVWITGKGFLHMMIRFIVGTIIEVGSGKRTSEELESLLRPDSQVPVKCLRPAPPEGLSLIRVLYGKNDPFS